MTPPELASPCSVDYLSENEATPDDFNHPVNIFEQTTRFGQQQDLTAVLKDCNQFYSERVTEEQLSQEDNGERDNIKLEQEL